ncbi:MAG TPA: hypothetical protein VJ784_13045 [Pyrinomonadaceae bacterium]|jgi:hypothetical protein|nr:hypothetical protein [Pyrinomonadaceae bacterium]
MNRGLILFLGLALLATGCGGGNSTSAPNNNQTPPPPAASPTASLTAFEQDLQYIRNGQYTYIWVFSRKDGKPLESTDSAFLRTNAPQVVDWVTTDGGKKVIGGTNFNLEEGNLEALKKRYNAEDYSNR